ncbi:MAG: family transporter [Pseudonocardiales bacterium]|nr:family transporter [Pseudonocardiales bacterium]
MNRLIRAIAMSSARHPWRTIASWFLVIGSVVSLAVIGGGTFADDFSVAGSQSARALELLDQSFPEAAKGKALVVLAAESDEPLEARRDAIRAALADVAQMAHVESVADPFSVATMSPDGRIAYAELTLDAPERQLGKPAFAALSRAVSGTQIPGVQVELGGDAVFLNAGGGGSGHVGIGLLVALLVLLVVFGTLVAAVVPIALSIVAVGAGIGAITLLAGTMDVSESAVPVAGLVGLGVGIDYALFVVARYRENRAAGLDNTRALADSMGSSGTAVVFAGGTVIIATGALALTGVGILTSIGLSTALMVMAAVASAITLLPALLSLLGDRIDTGRIARRNRPTKPANGSVWWRFGHRVSSRPWPYLLGAIATLVAVAAPALWMHTGFPAAGDAPAETTHRQAYDLLAQGFGTGFNGPLLVVVDLDVTGTQASGVPALIDDIAAVPGIASASEPRLSSDGRTIVFTAVPATGPADPETSRTIERVRAITPGNVYVAGITAMTDDLNSQLNSKLPLFIGAVIAVSFLLLMLVFRSIVVPLKAAAVNLLSIGGAYGVLVAVFQWGWGSELLGLEGPTPITSLIVVIMFPILFGLSMDYEVFLLSRIREEYLRTGDNAESVARGLAGTGRVISSAALIMIAVFASFVASPVPSLKMLGLGLATAILIDATVIRMMLVPATMALLGKANWWLPSWLDRLLPRLTIEAGDSASMRPEQGSALEEVDAPIAKELLTR